MNFSLIYIFGMIEPMIIKLIIRYFFSKRQDARLRSLYVTEDKEVIPTGFWMYLK